MSNYKFSKRSINNLNECHWILQEVAHEAIKLFDFTVIEGIRGEHDQNLYFNKGLTQKKFPQSAHNKNPSLAFDAVPFPVNWKDIPSFNKMGETLKKAFEIVSKRFNLKGVEFVWGGDYKSFKDRPHFEIKLSYQFIASDKSQENK